jgi:hypothetical protein
MKTIKMADHFRRVEARKAVLAAAGKLRSDDELRNSGLNRTEEKREFLRRIDERAKAAGQTPIKSNY